MVKNGKKGKIILQFFTVVKTMHKTVHIKFLY
jgi:hypothetical protein